MTHPQPIARIESLDFEGRGVAHVDGKTLFIDGGLPYETVRYSSYRKKPSYENADAVQVLNASFMRTTPRCPHFGVCGGCSMQHVEFSAQVRPRSVQVGETQDGKVEIRAGLAEGEMLVTPLL